MKIVVKDKLTKETLFDLSMKTDEIVVMLVSKQFTFEKNSYSIFYSNVEISTYSPVRSCEHNLIIFVTKL